MTRRQSRAATDDITVVATAASERRDVVAQQSPAPADRPAEALESEPRRTLRRTEIIVGVAIVASGVVMIVAAQQLGQPSARADFGGRWWPTVIGTAQVVLGVIAAVAGAIKPPIVDVEDVRLRGIARLAIVLAMIVAYGVAWQFVHFVIITPLLTAGLVWVLGGRGLTQLLVLPVIVTVVLYGMFALLLRVPL